MAKVIKIKLTEQQARELCELSERLDRENNTTLFTKGKSREERMKEAMTEREALFG